MRSAFPAKETRFREKKTNEKKQNKTKQKTKNLGAESEFLAIINNFLKKIANVNVPFVATLWQRRFA